MAFAKVDSSFQIRPKPPSRPGVYMFLGGEDRIMYVGMAHDLEKVLYRYQHLAGRKKMRDRVAAGLVSRVFWVACGHAAAPPSIELLAIQRYEPPWNNQHNPRPRSESHAVNFDTDEKAWLEAVVDQLEVALTKAETLHRAPHRESLTPHRETAVNSRKRTKLRGRDTCRDAVLLAFSQLERRTGRTDFRLKEIVSEVQGLTTEYAESTIRTHVVSVMCANANVHHQNHTDDLVRVGRGIYRRA